MKSASGLAKRAEPPKVQVYSRWGSLLYSRENVRPNDRAEGWDGTVDGEVLNAGVYVWTAEVEFVDGLSRVLVGELHLIR